MTFAVCNEHKRNVDRSGGQFRLSNFSFRESLEIDFDRRKTFGVVAWRLALTWANQKKKAYLPPMPQFSESRFG